MFFLLLMLLNWPQSHALGLYGPDNRMEIDDVDPRLQELARSTPALIALESITPKDGVLNFSGRTMGETDFVCKDERFKDQLAIAECSGTLVGPDLILTAAHCYKEESQCQEGAWVFDYKLGHVVPETNMYRCKEVAHIDTDKDFAIIRLDRKVTGRKIISLPRSKKVHQEKELVMLGYPRGVPLKATDQGFILKVKEHSFLSNLDAYLGNSGSGVFELETLELKGILSQGGQDYIYDGNKCASSSRSPMENGEEEISMIEGADLVVKRLQNVVPKISPEL